MQTVMTNKLKKMLKGALPFSEKETWVFKIERFEVDSIPEDFRPKFTLKPLTNAELEFAKKVTMNGFEQKDYKVNLANACKNSILNIECLFDMGKDEFLEFDKKKEFVYNLPVKMLQEILEELMEVSGMGNPKFEDEEKTFKSEDLLFFAEWCKSSEKDPNKETLKEYLKFLDEDIIDESLN